MKSTDLYVGVAIGALGSWGVWSGPGWVAAARAENWWNIATAIGTVATAFVAVLVPIWQQAKYQRYQDSEKALAAWRLAHEAYQAIGRMNDHVNHWILGDFPHSTVFSGTLAQLVSARAMAPDVLATTILGDLAGIASSLQAAATKRESAVQAKVAQGTYGWMEASVETMTRKPYLMEQRAQLKVLKETCEVWMESVQTNLRELGKWPAKSS